LGGDRTLPLGLREASFGRRRVPRGSYAAGRERADSDIDLYVIIRPEDHPSFIADLDRFMASWGEPTSREDVWNFEGLGFDLIVFELAEGVYGEVAVGTTESLLQMHGGAHRALVDKTGILDGISFPLR
jgi:hypothetical protein